MIPDSIFIRCHSFWRNDLYQPLSEAFPGVILFGAMRMRKSLSFWNSHECGELIVILRNEKTW
jgi:hypothetical protein